MYIVYILIVSVILQVITQEDRVCRTVHIFQTSNKIQDITHPPTIRIPHLSIAEKNKKDVYKQKLFHTLYFM